MLTKQPTWLTAHTSAFFFDSQIADDHRICDEGEPYVFLDEEWLIPCCNRHAAGRATDPENDNRMTPQ